MRGTADWAAGRKDLDGLRLVESRGLVMRWVQSSWTRPGSSERQMKTRARMPEGWIMGYISLLKAPLVICISHGLQDKISTRFQGLNGSLCWRGRDFAICTPPVVVIGPHWRRSVLQPSIDHWRQPPSALRG